MLKILFISATARVDRPYLDPSVRYRCYNPAMALYEVGIIADVISFKNFDTNVIHRYDILIFHRPQFGTKLATALKQIKIEGKKVFADYDDLIFSEKYALDSSIYKMNRASKQECLNIFQNNQSAMMEFDEFIVSTKPLADKILEINHKASITIIPNALSSDVINRISTQKREHKKIISDKRIISYLSGTKSHDMDFKIVENALVRLVKKYDNKIVIHLVGPLEYDKEKLPTAQHITYVDYEHLSKIIAKTHINIAPLEINHFTNCKSGLKFFESGILAVPSVVTPIHDMSRFNNSEGISYATTEDEWFEHLELLVTDDEYYEKKSNATYIYVINECTMKNVIHQYVNLFEEKEI